MIRTDGIPTIAMRESDMPTHKWKDIKHKKENAMKTENYQVEYVPLPDPGDREALDKVNNAHYLILEVDGELDNAKDVLSTIEKLELKDLHSATILSLKQFAMRMGLM